MRSRDKQRLRAEAAKAVDELPLPYVLEAVAKLLDVRTGTFEISMRDGFLSHVTRRQRYFEYRGFDLKLYGAFGDERLTPAGLWERPPQIAGRRVWETW